MVESMELKVQNANCALARAVRKADAAARQVAEDRLAQAGHVVRERAEQRRLDLNPDARGHFAAGIEFCLSRADAMTTITDTSVDVVFAFPRASAHQGECGRVLPRCAASCGRAAVSR
jgi:hypothetical protein